MDAALTGMVQRTLQPDPIGITTAHQCSSTGSAHSLSNIEVCEPRPLRGQAIQVRSADVCRPEAAYVAITEIVSQDDNDVRRSLLCSSQAGLNQRDQHDDN